MTAIPAILSNRFKKFQILKKNIPTLSDEVYYYYYYYCCGGGGGGGGGGGDHHHITIITTDRNSSWIFEWRSLRR
jgi:hypothetical protein